MVAGLKRAWADPEVRARRVAGMKRALAERGVALPEMTGEQRNLYRKLHPLVGREAALAEVFREAAPDEDDLAPDDRREIA